MPFGSYQSGGKVCGTGEPPRYSTPPALDDQKITELFQKTGPNKSAKGSTLSPTDGKENCQDGTGTLEPETTSKGDHVGLCSGNYKSIPQGITVEAKDNNHSDPKIEVCTGACFQAKAGDNSQSSTQLDPNKKAGNGYPIQFKLKNR